MQKSKIPWCTHTWNPCVGCSLPLVSVSCEQCYARKLHNMRHEAYKAGKNLPKQYAKPFEEIQLFHDRLDEPIRCRAKNARIFVGSMTDLFGKEVPFEFIDKVFDITQNAPQHIYQILTKRIDRMLEYCKKSTRHRFWDCSLSGHEHQNLHLGVTVCNPEEKWKIDVLSRIPAAVRFISFEPLLADMGEIQLTSNREDDTNLEEYGQHIDWVILGGESGPKARPMHPDWVRSIRDQCQAAGVPFFFKQWGEWLHERLIKISSSESLPDRKGDGYGYRKYTLTNGNSFIAQQSRWCDFARVGKKKAGCLLDGREWKEYPKMTREQK